MAQQVILDFQPLDIIFICVILFSALVVLGTIWKLYLTYRKRQWLVPATGMAILAISAALDLFDEYHELGDKVDFIENLCFVTGITIFSLGLLLVVTQLVKMATVDPLTGIPNKRRLEEILAQEIESAARTSLPLTVIFLDIDHFKQINDQLGHLAGDSVLRNAALLLRGVLRAHDHLARFGGDEFVIIMPDTASHQVVDFIPRLQRALNQLTLPGGRRVGASLGWAQYPDQGENPSQILASASKRMLESRKTKK